MNCQAAAQQRDLAAAQAELERFYAQGFEVLPFAHIVPVKLLSYPTEPCCVENVVLRGRPVLRLMSTLTRHALATRNLLSAPKPF